MKDGGNMDFDPMEGTGVYCNKCGCEMIIEDLRYMCPYCGRILKEHVEPAKKRSWFAVLMAIIVVLITAAGIVVWMLIK